MMHFLCNPNAAKKKSNQLLIPQFPTTTMTLPTHDYIQQDLHGSNQVLLDVKEYGDKMQQKKENTFRIMLHNINRLPINGDSTKSYKLISTIANKQIDVALMTEVGLFWKVINNKDRWYERIGEAFWSTKHEFAYNTTEPARTDPVQWGGVGIMAVSDASHRVVSQGSDPSGLGRWAWLRLAERDNHHL